MECRSCGSGKLVPFLDLGKQPFANSLLKTADAPEKSYPLDLVFCEACSLVQLTYTADPKELFSNYIWVTGTSSTARNQAARFCDGTLARLTPGSAPRLVVEVASNDGTFLRPFQTRNIPVLGVDPAKNVADQANADGVPTLCAFFGADVARNLIAERGPVDLIIARNVLPHVANLHSFVEGLAAAAGNTGLVAVEFHYGYKILEGLQYDSIYHEHLCYFTVASVECLLQRVGLEIVDLEEGPINAGAMVLYARKAGIATPSAAVAHYKAQEAKSGTNTLAAWHDFGAKVFRHRDQLLDILNSEVRAGRRTVGYGASARSSTMLNFCGITTSMLPEVADAAPLKQNLFTAGSHIPIRAPEQVFAGRPDNVLLLAWNFKDEIVNILTGRLGFSGGVIHPLPHAPVIQTLGR
jgi:hypothetical protein